MTENEIITKTESEQEIGYIRSEDGTKHRHHSHHHHHHSNNEDTDSRKVKLWGIDKNAHHRASIERLRIILMFFMCINLYSFPTVWGDLLKTICGFAPIAFFILSGYLVLQESENRSKRIVRAIKRTAIVFAVLAVVYFGINFIYYRTLGVNVFVAFTSKRFWFNFLVMNVWQFNIGTTIWYVQALLYAYIIIYFLDKWKLLRFDWIISAVLIALTVCTGELAGIIKWNILGYTYLPGNFLTRALPYILLGSFVHRKINEIQKLRRAWHILFIIGGALLCVWEMWLLSKYEVPGYYGHLLGMGIIAFGVCMLAFTDTHGPGLEKYLKMSRRDVNCIYYICEPMGILIAWALLLFSTVVYINFTEYLGIATFVVCLGISWLIALIKRLCFKKKKIAEE